MSDFRERDIEIAKLLGFSVAKKGPYWELYKDGSCVDYAYSEDVAWSHIPKYSANSAACSGLLLEVMGKGWPFFGCHYSKGVYNAWIQKGLQRPAPKALAKSELPVPALAYADAVSQLCLEVLKVEERLGEGDAAHEYTRWGYVKLIEKGREDEARKIGYGG